MSPLIWIDQIQDNTMQGKRHNCDSFSFALNTAVQKPSKLLSHQTASDVRVRVDVLLVGNTEDHWSMAVLEGSYVAAPIMEGISLCIRSGYVQHLPIATTLSTIAYTPSPRSKNLPCSMCRAVILSK
jgi:hypothetical protein